ncbi:hypothetical protein [Streptomyces sp. NPDC003327]
MAKLTAPALEPGARLTLSNELHALHRQAGWPSVRALARALGAGVSSSSRIHDVFTKPRLPDWGVVELIVHELASRVPGFEADTEIKRFHRLWDNAAAAGDATLKQDSISQKSGSPETAITPRKRLYLHSSQFPTLSTLTAPLHPIELLNRKAKSSLAEMPEMARVSMAGQLYASLWFDRSYLAYDVERIAGRHAEIPDQIKIDLYNFCYKLSGVGRSNKANLKAAEGFSYRLEACFVKAALSESDASIQRVDIRGNQ